MIAVATLPESSFVEKNATLLTRFRRGQPFPGDPQLVWTINGEKGEIRVVSEGASALQVLLGTKKPIPQVHDFQSNQVGEVDWEYKDWQEELPMASRNVGSMYEAWADGKGYPTFDDAAVRHEQLEAILGDWKA